MTIVGHQNMQFPPTANGSLTRKGTLQPTASFT